MQPSVRKAIAGWAIAVALLTSIDVLACQPPPTRSLQEQLDEAVGAVHAKVMSAHVRHLSQLGMICKSVICDILEVQLEIFETFKGNPDDYLIIFAPVPTMCVTPIMPGVEYVLFLEEFEGFLLPNEYSFFTDFGREDRRVTELRDLSGR